MNRFELSDTMTGAVRRRDYVKRLYFENGGSQRWYDNNLFMARGLVGYATNAAKEGGFEGFISKYSAQTELLMKFTSIERYNAERRMW